MLYGLAWVGSDESAGNTIAAHVLLQLGVTPNKLFDHDITTSSSNISRAHPKKDIPLHPQTRLLIEKSYQEANDLDHEKVGTEQLLLALVKIPDCGGALCLEKNNLNLGSIAENVMFLLGDSVSEMALEILQMSKPDGKNCISKMKPEYRKKLEKVFN